MTDQFIVLDGTKVSWLGGQPYWISSNGDKFIEIDHVPEDERQDWLDKGWTFTKNGKAIKSPSEIREELIKAIDRLDLYKLTAVKFWLNKDKRPETVADLEIEWVKV